MRLRHLPLLGLSVLALGACDSPMAPSPQAAPPEVLTDAAVARFARQVAESDRVRLPSMGRLLRAARAAIEAQGGNEEAVRHFRRARRLGAAAEAAHAAGNDEEARRLARRSHHQKLAGIIAALGTGAVDESVAGARAGLDRIRERLEGRDVPERITKAVDRIGRGVGAAEEAWGNGAHVAALHHALAAAEGIRMLSPRYAARRWIQRATNLLGRARDALGDAPTEEEGAAIARAAELLAAAVTDLEEGRPARAAARARRAAHLAWGVVQGRR